MRRINLFIKTILDYLVGFLGILFLSPLIISIIILIRLDSPGAAIFKQERLGRDGQPFMMSKFRTMVQGAEKLGDGLIIKSEEDRRLTRFGKILRKTSLDELPQLLNILKGQMSLVGPRPPVSYHPYRGYEAYPDWAKKRFRMKPGLTGLTQVTIRNSLPWEGRFAVDNQYIDNFSLALDMKIIYWTIKRLVKPQEIYFDHEKKYKADKQD